MSMGRFLRNLDWVMPAESAGNRSNMFTDDEILTMWPQAQTELDGFASLLEQRSGITASQLRLALQLAEKEYARLQAAAAPPDKTE